MICCTSAGRNESENIKRNGNIYYFEIFVLLILSVSLRYWRLAVSSEYPSRSLTLACWAESKIMIQLWWQYLNKLKRSHSRDWAAAFAVVPEIFGKDLLRNISRYKQQHESIISIPMWSGWDLIVFCVTALAQQLWSNDGFLTNLSITNEQMRNGPNATKRYCGWLKTAELIRNKPYFCAFGMLLIRYL